MIGTAIRTESLTRRFGHLTAVDHLDLEIPAGGVIGFVGPNGSGKSTTIRMLLGLIKPTEGSAQVLGEAVTHPEAFAPRVGALIESPAFVPNISGRANVRSMARLRDLPMRRVDEVLGQVGLAERGDDQVRTYSLGMKQRLGIAIALLPDPELLVLDEPTNGLDPGGIVEMRTLLRSLGDEGRTVLVSSHLLSEIEAAADHLVVIRSGRLLFAGPLKALLEQERRSILIETEHLADLARLMTRYLSEGLDTEAAGSMLEVAVDPRRSVDLNRWAIEEDIVLRRLEPRSETLEDVFLRMTDGASEVA